MNEVEQQLKSARPWLAPKNEVNDRKCEFVNCPGKRGCFHYCRYHHQLICMGFDEGFCGLAPLAVDREGMRSDLLAMAERADAERAGGWAALPQYSLWVLAQECRAFADDLAQRNAG
jgi:hypothetical protein